MTTKRSARGDDISRQVTTGMGCELMKLLRHNRLSCRQIAELLGWHVQSAEKWVREYVAQGFLMTERATCALTGTARGRRPMLYTVAPIWRSNGALP